MIDSPYLVKPGSKVDLSAWDTRDRGPFESKEQAAEATRLNLDALGELQEVLYAQAKHPVLIVLQAMDTGGKDGTIEHIFGAVDPQGCRVTSFKAPTPLEKSHDFLWRIHAAAPEPGMIGIFNRSHYESVLIERVRQLAPKDRLAKRYDHINAFEKMLVDEGTTILKLFLHISTDEQRERLQARIDEPHKRWKFNPGDLAERERWDEYQAAYADALSRCSTPHAPWYVVPADRKWYRNYVVSDLVLRTLRGLDLRYPAAAPGVEKIVVS